MSYQAASHPEDGLPVNVQQQDEIQTNARNWNAVLVATGLGLTGLLAVAASGLGSSVKTTSLIENSPSIQRESSGYVKQYDTLDETALSNLFAEFRAKFNKKYADDEEVSRRFEYFKDFLSTVDKRNAEENQPLHDITKFADLSADEFRETYLGFQVTETQKKAIAARKAAYASKKQASRKATEDLGPKKPTGDSSDVTNWYMVSTTAVKNQGYCGSCWAFSATEQVESDSIIAGLLTTSDELAPQQIVSCASSKYDCYGCDGGDPIGAYEYIEATGGLQSSSSYPYESYYGDTETCDATSSDYEVTVTGYTILDSEDDMITYVTETGPLSVCLDASSWSSYSKGVVSVCGDEVDHCVQVTGINTGEDYWIVRNSWGTDWGVGGFIYLKSGQNTCDITYLPSYTAVEAV